MTVFSMFTVSYFDPLPSCEGRLDQGAKDLRQQIISIRSPLTRGDLVGQDHQADFVISIHSPHTRGDRYGVRTMRLVKPISIHSPHTRGDAPHAHSAGREKYFNPLPSHEGRPKQRKNSRHIAKFQSTPLTRGETGDGLVTRYPSVFQSTPLTRGETKTRS